MKDIFEKFQNSKLYEKVSELMGSLKADKIWENLEKKADEVIARTDITDTVGEKISKFVAKTFKKFSAWWHKDGNIVKTIFNVVGKIVAVAATIAFMVLVGYVLIKILPELIMIAALFFAVMIGIKVITGVVGKAINVK
jgi:uncharacterized membrane protein YheB (UPF0754 family)